MRTILKNSNTQRNIFTISFIIAVFVLFFISNLSYQQIESLKKTDQLVIHTYKTQMLLEQLVSCTKDAETAQRGFLIIQDSAFLTPYLTAQQYTDSIFNELEIQTKGSPQQQQNLKELKPILKHHFELLDSKLKDAAEDNYVIKPLKLKSKMLTGKVIMDLLRQKVNEMIDIENDALAKHQLLQKQKFLITPVFSLLLLFFSLIVFAFAFYKINKDIKKLNGLTLELILIKESFEHAEEIAKMSHWQWDLETNELTYSDNQYLLLGCQPKEFKPTIEEYLKFVHPDDRAIVLEGGNLMLTENKASDSIFRIIRKDGMLRYIKSTGRILVDEKGKKIAIGINYDITEQYLSSIALEEKNSELLRSNSELASFNHVASHDLQEPLRKIQLFISRILDDKTTSLSEKNLEYFNKVQASAQRMQTLINDLLSYSRVNGSNNIFEKVELNSLIENVLYEIEQTYASDEKNITVHFKNLPVIMGIPFQLKQLFTNLIENSLKYSDAKRLPVVNIEASIEAGETITAFKADNKKQYYKIIVSDNGIGFDQTYAEQIFTLFQRLHGKKTFSGTGIGLAICKKVVENHNGFITAEGKPTIGATFTIYLPIQEEYHA